MTATARLSLLALSLPLLVGAAPSVRVVVKGNGTALGETPIVAATTAPIPPGRYVLRSGASAPVPASVVREGEATYLAAVLDRVPAGGETVYDLVADSAEGSPGGVALAAEGRDVAVTVDGRPFTTYVSHDGPKPYYFPLIGPTGRPMTRAYPMKDVAGETRDHPHHRSLWFTHGKVNGVDFWSEAKGHGTIVETSARVAGGAPAVATIRTTDDWVGPDKKVVCTDERVVRFYATKSARVLDFDVTIKASHGPVTFGDTKEGMFGLRVATSMDVLNKKGGGKITNSEGLVDGAAWGKPARWVDYSGPVEGEAAGIAVLDHPSSFRHPTTWHVRTYGLFAANPFGWHDFGMKQPGDHVIPAGGSIRFAYRVILHRGDAASADLPAAYSAYAQPPTVEVKAD